MEQREAYEVRPLRSGDSHQQELLNLLEAERVLSANLADIRFLIQHHLRVHGNETATRESAVE